MVLAAAAAAVAAASALPLLLGVIPAIAAKGLTSPAPSARGGGWSRAPPRKLTPWRPVPQTGSQRLLVINTAFNDAECSFSAAQWKERFFGEHGFADYFRNNSYGQLQYIGEVIGLDSEGKPSVNSQSVDCVKVPDNVSFYANDLYGFKTERCSRRSASGVVLDALTALDAAGFDFSPYADPQKELLNIVVLIAAQSWHFNKNASASFLSTAYEMRYIFQGCGENAPPKVNSKGYFQSTQGYEATLFTFCTSHTFTPSDFAAFGICLHEHTHALGMVDEYGVGQYSIMGQGLWGPDQRGQYPGLMSAFDKAHVGWIEPEAVQPSEADTEYTLLPSHTSRDALRLQMRDVREYFLVENRQRLAWGNPEALGKAPRFCPGLLVWHIDQSIADNTSTFWRGNNVNRLGDATSPPHRGIQVAEADADNSVPVTEYACNDTLRLGNGVFQGVDALLWDGTDSGVVIKVLSNPDPHTGALRITVRCPQCNASATTPSTSAAAPTAGPGTGPQHVAQAGGAVMLSCGMFADEFGGICLGNNTATAQDRASHTDRDCVENATHWETWAAEKLSRCCAAWHSVCAADALFSDGAGAPAPALRRWASWLLAVSLASGAGRAAAAA